MLAAGVSLAVNADHARVITTTRARPTFLVHAGPAHVPLGVEDWNRGYTVVAEVNLSAFGALVRLKGLNCPATYRAVMRFRVGNNRRIGGSHNLKFAPTM